MTTKLVALVGLTLPDGKTEVRVEAGETVPQKLLKVIPELWLHRIVEIVEE